MQTLFCLLPIIIILTLRLLINNNNDKKNEEAMKSYHAREQEARFARNKDISNIELFVPDLTGLPLHIQEGNKSAFSTDTDIVDAHLEELVISSSKEPMLNLQSMSNTDIKLEYGVGNFQTVSKYDQNYLYFTSNVFQWGKYLYDNKLFDDARVVLEYVLTLSDNMSLAYTMLGSIYLSQGEIQLITELIHKVETSDSLTGKSTCNKLRNLINNY
ncbi:MAG: hypothetical protein E7265_09115 [Lachnospiraceae bacterium]|nr:hypothetical protein [Lachnospiraceae bacterium]